MTYKNKRRLIKRYQEFLASYDELHLKEQTDKYEAALKVIPLGEDFVIADFGCGTGLFLRHISDVIKSGVGVDISRKHLYRARERLGKNCHLVQADIEQPPFKDDVFDYVFSFTVLHHIEKLDEVIANLSSFARKGLIVSILRHSKAAEKVGINPEIFKTIKILDFEPLKDLIILLDLTSKQ